MGSSPTTGTTSPRTSYRSRRLFCKSHLSLILSRLLSKPNPLRWASIWVPLTETADSVSPLIPKRKDFLSKVLSFWVSSALGRLHTSVFQMLGGSEFRLRRGFACGKTLLRRKCAASQKAGCSGWMQSFRNFKISILTILHSSSCAHSAAPRFQITTAYAGL